MRRYVRQDRKGRVRVLRTLHVIDVFRVLGLELLHLCHIAHLIDLRVENFLVKLVCIVLQKQILDLTQLQEGEVSTRLLIQRVLPKDAIFATRRHLGLSSEELDVIVDFFDIGLDMLLTDYRFLRPVDHGEGVECA